MSFDVRFTSPHRPSTPNAKAKQPASDSQRHPLDHPSSSSSLNSFTSAIRDGTLTRPNLRRHIHSRGASAFEYPSASNPVTPAADDEDDDRPRVRRRSSSSGAELSRVDVDSWATSPGASTSLGDVFRKPADPSVLSGGLTREVVVHEVQSSDSLAGVALQYGIKVAALRKANKLWPSDSIHLRKILYIPVDWQKSKASTWAKGRAPPIVEEEFGDNHPSETLRVDRTSTPYSEHFGAFDSLQTVHASFRNEDYVSEHPTTTAPKSQTKRIPISELSFFPPSSTNNILLSETSNRPPHVPITNHPRPSTSSFGSFGVGNGVSRLARMSTESLSSISGSLSLTRNSTSDADDRDTGLEMEMDVAKDWISTSLNASRSTLKNFPTHLRVDVAKDGDAKVRAWRDNDRDRPWDVPRMSGGTITNGFASTDGRRPWNTSPTAVKRDPNTLAPTPNSGGHPSLITNRQPTSVPPMSIPRSANSTSLR